VLTYGTSPEADLRADRLRLGVDRTAFRLTVAGEGEHDVTTRLVGRHNVMNLLAAIGAAISLQVEPCRAVAGASAVEGVAGRLERVLPDDEVHAFVDYAHTEEALREVLTFLRDVGATPITCVLGCGGDRDRTKRPLMARAAAELAERAVLTTDNPRTEDPQAILDDMAAGLLAAQTRTTEVIVDRREAIRHAVETAPAGSCVLVAGKGHETYQILGTERVPFDDAHVVRQALLERLRTLATDPGLSPGAAR
jgi:UDP-N-acetylmuramoyl-L-alanyl-D-glutamate--2,6-diaminopimelate ligase